ncbi:bile acid:sodium symporter [Croceicoccus ponticola]|uniref:Bile acid:sodium symporter n=2 Tax=Croceicoccus ponticola TaxID=2217664 RepID=A0A437H2E7_9SPHN|nr:bile acid:sodium symporter family protein [Croceicoccus ponticola]RVQ69726.1 bile acid:sodium symporter [Croceicoccus ponticola]
MTRLYRLFDIYILLMVTMIVLAMLVPAKGQGYAIASGIADVAIAFLFFLYGARISLKEAKAGLGQGRLQIAVLLSTFVLFPLVGLGLAKGLGGLLPPAIIAGVIYLTVLPSTVQSSIAFTSIARGNVPAALCAASASNIVGVFVSPILAGALIGGDAVDLSFGVFRDICLQLLLPFVVGQCLRPWIARLMSAHKKLLGYADRGSILLIIYVAFSHSVAEGIWSKVDAADLLLLSGVLAVLLAAVLLITAAIGRRVLRLEFEEAVVLQFCGSKKSLASGLPMATVVFAGTDIGVIVLPLMIFHQMQLVVSAFLAQHYARRADDTTPEVSLIDLETPSAKTS